MTCDGSANSMSDISGAIHTAIAGIDDTILRQNDFTQTIYYRQTRENIN